MMQRIGWAALLAALVLIASPSFAADDVTLEGGFVWEREDGNQDGDLKAIFTPTGEGEWSVEFQFDWEDGPHVYKGNCSGSLDGELSGDVVSDGDREMKFKFSGTFEDGEFSGSHGFVTEEGELKPAGTFTLGSAD